MCVCYSQPLQGKPELMYTVVLVHKGVLSKNVQRLYLFFHFFSFFLMPLFFFYLELMLTCILFPPSADCSKTFRVSLGSEPSPKKGAHLHPLFIPIGALHTQTRREQSPYTHVRIVMNSTQCLNLTVSTKSQQARKFKWERPHSCETINICRSCELANGEAVLFLYVGYYVLVYLQGFFLHCVNTRQQEMLCHSLFLSGGQKTFFSSFLHKSGQSCMLQWFYLIPTSCCFLFPLKVRKYANFTLPVF